MLASSPPRSPTTRRTHQRLVAATRSEIAARGNFSAERVAGRAGTSPATFYAYFPSKGDALAAAFETVMRDLLEFCEAELSIERLLEVGLETHSRNLTLSTIAFFRANERVFRLALAAFAENAELRDLYRNCETEALETLRRFVSLGQKSGRIRSGEIDPIARGLLVLLQGMNNPSALKAETADPVCEELGLALFAFLRP